jgi:Na+-translocating ferredoxin:NAD+ oxidoreductase RnfD subunit
MGAGRTLAGYPVLLPSVRDPRLHLAATIISLHVIGQVWLHFELSLTQILVSILTAATLELGIVFAERRVIAWPASAMLTGNGVAFVLRVNGTQHGDWWSWHGWYVFAAVSALGLLSKHLVRSGERPVFNPSNVALVLCFLVLGTGRVNPLDFWWGPMSGPMIAVVCVLVAGAAAVTRRVGMLSLSLTCWASFALGLAVPALLGHAMRARWSLTPVTDWTWWRILVTSPEVIVFLFFMVTDPKTTPRSPRGRVLFGAVVGLTAAALVAPARTEFWAKVSVLAALVVVCAGRWVLSRLPATLPARLTARTAVPAAVALALPVLAVASLPSRHPLGFPEPVAAHASASGPELALPAPTTQEHELAIVGGVGPTQAEAMRHALGRELYGRPMTVRSLTAVVVRDPDNPQAVPRLGLWARGVGVDTVYVMATTAEGYAVVGELAPAAAGVRSAR